MFIISRRKSGLMLFFIKLVVITVFCKFHCVHGSEDACGSGLYSNDGFIISSGEYIAVCNENNYKNNRTCCENNEFQCLGACIPLDKVCNSDPSLIRPSLYRDEVDCIDRSDEIGCSLKTCATRIDKCPQECIDLPNNKSKCSCYKGYHLITRNNNITCVDINECDIGLHSCSHDCKNLNGTFECSCREGYKKESNTSNNCYIDDTNTVILLYERNWIYAYNLTTGINRLVVRSSNAGSMDYDPDKNILYWSNSTSVTRSYLLGAKNGTVTSGHPQVVYEFGDNIERDSLAIDWAARNMYWLSPNIFDELNSDIMVSKLDGRYVKTLLEIPRASSLVVDPEFGKMYWASGGHDPHIGSAWMNGMFRSTVVRLPNRNPIALTLDHLSNGRLYWVDSLHHTIYCVFKFEFGSRTRKVYTTTPEQSPISLDVFENNLYWITKELGELLTIDKFGKGEVKSLLQYLDNSFIKVYHKRKIEKKSSPGGVSCSEQCSHLCLLKPRGYTCTCPDGNRVVPVGGEIVCDNEKLEPMEDPLDCNCDNKELVSNTSSPYSQCYCEDYDYDIDVPNFDGVIITRLPLPLFLVGIVVVLLIVATILSFYKKANV